MSWTTSLAFTPVSLGSLGLFPLPASPFLAPETPEAALVGDFLRSEITEAFPCLDRLQTLYVRHSKQGGLEGTQWLRTVREALHQHIEEEQLYGQFLFEEGGRHLLNLPAGLPRPPVLRMGEDLTIASLLHLPHHNLPQVGALAYFRIEDLVLGQDLLSLGNTVFFEELLWRNKGFSPVVIARDLRTEGRYHLHDGHHRVYASRQRGYGYVLGKMNREAKLTRVQSSWATMSLLPHDEFLRRISPNLTTAFPDAAVDEPLF